MTFWSHRNRLQLLPALAIAWLLSVFISYSEAKLIHRYGFEGFETTAIDSVGQKHGSFEGGAKLTGSGSIRLDGVNDFVNLPSGLLSGHEDATLEAWVIWDGPASESWARIFEFGKDDRNYLYLTPRTGSSPRHARLGIAANGPEKKVNAADQLSGDGKTMNHLVVSIHEDTSLAIFYIDGEIQGTTSMPVALADFPDENAWLGRSHYSWVPPFDGQIHEFRIYDHALNDEQVLKNQSAGPDVLPGPVIHQFEVSSEAVHTGDKILLSWSLSDGASGTINPGGIIVDSLTGTAEVQVLTDTTYVLTVEDSDGVRSAEAEVIIDDRPQVVSFTVNPAIIVPGGEVTLSWDVDYADKVYLDGILQEKTTKMIKVMGPRTFVLNVENNFGDRKATADVHVEVTSGLKITEFLAANNNGITDEFGESSDWIEIENTSSSATDLSQWFLTDDLDNLERWAFPAGTTLAAGARLIIRASGRDEVAPKGELHTNFKIGSNKGGFLALVHKNGFFGSYFFDYPRQRTDFSYGATDLGQVVFFATPTPGKSNSPSGLAGFVKDTKFSHDRGFYEIPFQLTITCATSEATLYYTTDGSLPDPQNPSAFIYEKPLPVSTTTTLRVRAFLDGYEPSNTDTQTYLFLEHVIQQPVRPEGYPSVWATGQNADYAMDPRITASNTYKDRILPALRSHPTLAISVDIDAMFGNSPGIYSHPTAKGIDWEIPASLELMDFAWADDKQVDCGIRMQGNASRQPSRPKHNMRLVFRDRYGAGRLEYQLFENIRAKKFNNVILRGQNGDSWIHPNGQQRLRATFLRDQWHRAIRTEMGHETINQSHVHVYINGLYWGFFHMYERAEAEMMAENHGGDPEDYDVVQDFNKTAGKIEVLDGTIDAWDAMFPLANEVVAGNRPWQDMRQLVDMENFVDYMILNFFSGNTDWDKGNWRAARNRGVDSPGWWFFSWDSERTLWSLNQNATGLNFASRATGLHQILAKDPGYQLFFADRVHKLFNNGGALTHSRASATWNRLAEEVSLPLVAESARWGDTHRASDPYDPDTDWAKESQWMTNTYFQQRPATVLTQFRSRNLYPALDPPTLSQHGGRIESGSILNISSSQGDLYFTTDGSDPRLSDGSINPEARQGESLQITKALTLRARAQNGSDWSPLTEASFSVELQLRISEIYYAPKDSTHSEFLEIINAGSGPASLDGVSLSDGVEFEFSIGTELAPGERIILVSDKVAFANLHPEVPIGGVFNGKLRNEGERIAISTLTGETIFEVTYDNNSPWPLSASGGGRTLVLKDGADPADPQSWSPSSQNGGSPGTENPEPSGDSDSDGLPDEWELQHFGDFNQPADGDFDADGLANLLEYAFGSSPSDSSSINLPHPSIQDGQYLTVSYERLTGTDLTLTIQFSDDLKAWSSDPAGIQTVSVITNGSTETVTVREIASISNRKHRFLRVSATVD